MTAPYVPRIAIIPTHNRHEILNALIESIQNDVDNIIIIDNASSPPVTLPSNYGGTAHITLITDAEQPPNLSRFWNIGLDTAQALINTRGIYAYDIAIFNDDTVLPDNWFNIVSSHLRAHPSAAAASTASYAPIHSVYEKMAPDGDLMHRMCPWAFITRGELNIRADESLRWWWGDTDFDWTCRQRGGVLIVPGPVALNSAANSTTIGELLQQAGRDGETFTQKWGWRPW